MTVRLTNNLTQWVKFFLVGVIETSKESIQVFKDIIALKNNIETERLPKLGSKIEKGQLIDEATFSNTNYRFRTSFRPFKNFRINCE